MWAIFPSLNRFFPVVFVFNWFASFSRLDILDEMAVSDELTETQVRQLLFDLETSYNDFNRLLHNA